MAVQSPIITIEAFNSNHSDLAELQDIFYRSVHGIGIQAYTQAQCEAWAPAGTDYYYWTMRLKELKTYFAVVNDKKVGFISFRKDGYIDFIYVLPEWKGKKVAQKLYDFAETELLGNPFVMRIWVDASYLAKPFFEKNGFRNLSRNEIKLQGEVLVNFTMEKSLINLS